MIKGSIVSLSAFLDRDKKHGTSSHRRAPRMEKELAARSGGRVTPGSGNGYLKGDVHKAWGAIRIEAKTTKRKSFAITRDMIRKIEEAAGATEEVPVIVVEFIDETGKPEMEVAIVPTYALPLIAGVDDA